MPTYMASTISPKWSAKRPTDMTRDGILDVHVLDAECAERLYVMHPSVVLRFQRGFQHEADRRSTLSGLQRCVRPRYVQSGVQQKMGSASAARGRPAPRPHLLLTA